MNFSPLSYWIGVLTILIGEIFIVMLIQYLITHFSIDEEEDDDGSAEKRN